MVAARRRGAGRARVRAGHRAACAALAGQLAVVGAGLLAAVVLWRGAAGPTRPRAWRLLAAAPLLPVVGRPAHARRRRLGPGRRGGAPLGADGARLPRRDRRHPGSGRPAPAARRAPDRASRWRCSSPPAWSSSGCCVVGPDGRWSTFGLSEQLVLGSAVARHLRHHGRRPDPAGRRRGRPPADGGRRCSPAPSSSPSGRGLATSALLVGHAAGAGGRRPRPHRRRPAAPRPRRAARLPAARGCRRPPATAPGAPASSSARCCRTSPC